MERRGGDDTYSFPEICDQWVNFSSFLAHCIGAGLNDNYPDGCKHPIIDIPHGLEQDQPPGLKRDCRVMVAAQYILLAGRKLADESFKWPDGADKWRRWAGKLEEISKEEGDNTSLASAAREVHQYMVSLRPEIFEAPQDTRTDVADSPEQTVSQG